MTPVPTSENTRNPVPTVGGDPMQQQAQATQQPQSVAELPTAALELAGRMFDMARSGDDTLLSYMEAGIPPNLTNNRGDTLLMLAAYHGHTSLVRSMLTSLPNKPDPNQLNGRGQSILAGVVFKGHADIVPLLLEAGADPLAGQPSAEDSAKMFNKWDGQDGFKEQFENAPGRGQGAKEAPPAVEDREEVRRVPGQGPQESQSSQ